MASTQLPWLFLKRRIRPYALALSLAQLPILITGIVTHDDYGDLLDTSVAGDLVGVFAGLSALALWLGWWLKSDWWMRTGFLISTGVMTSRAVYLFADETKFGWILAIGASAWAIASAGAYLLEVTEQIAPELGRR